MTEIATSLPPEVFTDPEQMVHQWIDLHPSFGWNVPRYGRNSVGLSIALQCAAVKARDIAKADMFLWREQTDGSFIKVKSKQNPLARLLRRKPNEYQSWGDFWRMIVMHMELAQNAYIIPLRDRQGNLLELVPIMPTRARQAISNQGRIWYEIATGTDLEAAQLGYTMVQLPADRIIHLRGKTLDGLNGMSNVGLGGPIFDLLTAISSYQTKLFTKGGRTQLVFEMDGQFDKETGEVAFQRLKRQLAEKTRKMNEEDEAVLLEGGLKAKPISVNPRDALTTEAYNQQVSRICGLMEVPPHKIFQYESVKYDNQSAANAQYANDSLIPIAKNIEDKFRLQLLDDGDVEDVFPEFDRMAILAGDPKTLMDILGAALDRGVVTKNEARERIPIGLSRVKGGDVFNVPVNMAQVDLNGNVTQPATGQLPAGPAPAAAVGDPAKDEPAKHLRLAASNE